MVGLEGVVVEAADTRETRLRRCADCHCNRTERGARRKNILNPFQEDVQQMTISVELHSQSEKVKTVPIPTGTMFCLVFLSRVQWLFTALEGHDVRASGSPSIADDFPTAFQNENPGHECSLIPVAIPRQNY